MSEGNVRLYELVLDNGRSASPYVWRIRYALAHKGLKCEPVPVGFTEISGIENGRFKTVPIIQHGSTVMSESWDIAEHLETIDRYTTLAARQMHEDGRRAGLLQLAGHPPLAFLRNYIARGGVREGVPGFIISSMNAYYVFLKFAKLRELDANGSTARTGSRRDP